jgi:putative addiction module antidote
MLSSKVIDVGSSSGLILNKEVLSILGVKKGDTIFFTRNAEGGLVLTPYDPDFEEQMKLGEQIMQRDRDVLRALAK